MRQTILYNLYHSGARPRCFTIMNSLFLMQHIWKYSVVLGCIFVACVMAGCNSSYAIIDVSKVSASNTLTDGQIVVVPILGEMRALFGPTINQGESSTEVIPTTSFDGSSKDVSVSIIQHPITQSTDHVVYAVNPDTRMAAMVPLLRTLNRNGQFDAKFLVRTGACYGWLALPIESQWPLEQKRTWAVALFDKSSRLIVRYVGQLKSPPVLLDQTELVFSHAVAEVENHGNKWCDESMRTLVDTNRDTKFPVRLLLVIRPGDKLNQVLQAIVTVKSVFGDELTVVCIQEE